MSANVEKLLSSVPTGLLIGGRWRGASTSETFPVHNPATGEVLAEVAAASSDDARAALDAAVAAQDQWAATAPQERADILRRAYDLIGERSEEFATLMTLEMGKPIAEARGEVTYGANYLRWFSEETVRTYGRYSPNPEGTQTMITRRKPVGPCLLITPWNFPLAMGARKVAPALAAGCTVVLKPAKLTPLTTALFAAILQEAGVPAGVVNVVPSAHAAAISEPLLADARLRKVSFTGSTAVGRTLLTQAADNILRTSMELGGNAPFIVFADADIPAAADGAMAAKMRNIGEACTAANRILVHQDVAEEFTAELARRFAELTIGNGLDETVTVGPLIQPSAVDHLTELVEDATAHGGEIVCGGSPLERDGYFFAPTIITGADTSARVFTEEIFGPLAPIFTFSDEQEAYALANDTEYGLASYVFTADYATAMRAADALEFGLVGWNAGAISNAAAPFGGVKHSGMGREGSVEGIEEYTEVQYIAVPR
ncbi:NAD-dependent succinate-semialdehyde dehydrogenase [Corynebacterium uberis]|uniref:NAD-dependent succinate-semialdehyde dehydrogenase n=1 Tax=Corynebacterium TaxID=1716 RepID=UPI001D0B68C3|nr:MULTISPECIES: NAD-dependent succinate-semialdehyde dehydrogenase [Corynebacterium]MCZ9310043.1 NAD-dependent succinate-semialdehyde dehydrogenase [Corynebacterium sp. c6VSa_13]UDL73791.1 NAD-dependent succinate-semialdehyde dehydrogenase [Corynebacterium uberis]UDL75326.1 NAD-dependent succinate-semialdehyde dehydrogenase [Corynebacterium uberis]UDL77537.1 NAD-dependent succinate-semialdehyde dehydrogenase [Corynebacterium uberis]UDL79824.1 NAD-dependent succinate-semialdehyde dehydrogenase